MISGRLVNAHYPQIKRRTERLTKSNLVRIRGEDDIAARFVRFFFGIDGRGRR